MKFGQYELRELIAVGGMAEVYKGRVVGAEGFEKDVAIKRILPDLAEDERFVKMLLTEARIHSALSHRNIVQIHDLGISGDGEYFIVLEYVEGYDLRVITDQLAAEGEIIPEALSLHIAGELAQGLHYAHELRGPDGQPLGLVHRDVTPSNVLISKAGEVKLSDFGLAKRRHDRSVVGSLKGNLAYMAPEQARQADLDRRTDVFSLGAVLFEMLTGKRLREITDEVEGVSFVASGQVPSVRAARPDLPESFERLLATALAPEPALRYADAAAFGAAIRETLAEMNTPVGASDLQALLATVNPPRRPRSLVSEVSKVIRLGPEARALGEAIASVSTPRPATPPGLTPISTAARGGVTGLPGEGNELPPTPPPSAPLP
ncbi:MAG TPA: serine/threonine-protein kinase, partial [Polyangia bacterium]|nr:serine/threonine-protein kinase [Polyangia bacterium]